MKVAKRLGVAAAVCIAAAAWAVARLLACLNMGKLFWPIVLTFLGACLVMVWLVALRRGEADNPRSSRTILALVLVCLGTLVLGFVALYSPVTHK